MIGRLAGRKQLCPGAALLHLCGAAQQGRHGHNTVLQSRCLYRFQLPSSMSTLARLRAEDE